MKRNIFDSQFEHLCEAQSRKYKVLMYFPSLCGFSVLPPRLATIARILVGLTPFRPRFLPPRTFRHNQT